MVRYLELLSRVIEKFEGQLADSRWLPVMVLAAFTCALYLGTYVMVQIYSLHPVIVFVPVGYGPPPI